MEKNISGGQRSFILQLFLKIWHGRIINLVWERFPAGPVISDFPVVYTKSEEKEKNQVAV